ncbi:SulP family inorganic anion transporter [Pontibacter harenae]|uniref:SulP family inorganic anion transporter n=1 Tax=Pontibacter harenae TaxID=2894083 RepID=UPI001E443DB8|nr:SulP family inorganic anion transporter [Pontibacter harenae]MCC9168937.1 SulP family inorganic anion transporter [Pontibacter harenae]
MKGFTFTKGDIFGGLTAGIVALPLALAFGLQSGLGAAAGLYGAIILGLLSALLGGTYTQISGPTGPMTVVATAAIAGFIQIGGSLEAVAGAIVATFIFAGIIQAIMGVIRLGVLIRFIPYPVISGFMSGIGVIIILLQLFPAIGQPSPPTTIDVIREIGPAFSNINVWALLYAALTVVIVYLFPRISKTVPGTLVALIGVTILSVVLQKDVEVIGTIPSGLPEMQIGSLFTIDPALFGQIIRVAITLAALGAIDSLLTSVVADNVTKTRHDSNRELIGQGIGNSVAGIFGGLPGAGATMRTLVNVRSGGTSRWSGIIHSATLAIILLAVGTYAALIPKAVLAGLLITVGLGILDFRGLKHIRVVPRTDAAIMIVVLLVTVFLDLLTAVGVGMIMASLFFMKKMSDSIGERTQLVPLSTYDNGQHWNDRNMPAELEGKVLVKHIEGPLFFGFASGLQKMAEGVVDVSHAVYRMEEVPFIDQTGLYSLQETLLTMNERGIKVILTGLLKQPEHMLRKGGIIPQLIPDNNVCPTFPDAVDCIVHDLRENEAPSTS